MALVRLTVSDLFALLIMFSIMAIHYTHNNSNNTVYPCMCAWVHQTFKHKKIGKGNNNRNSNSNVNTHIASASPKSKRRFRGKSPKSNSNAMLGFSARRDQHVVLVIAPPSLTHSQLQCCVCFSLSQQQQQRAKQVSALSRSRLCSFWLCLPPAASSTCVFSCSALFTFLNSCKVVTLFALALSCAISHKILALLKLWKHVVESVDCM